MKTPQEIHRDDLAERLFCQLKCSNDARKSDGSESDAKSISPLVVAVTWLGLAGVVLLILFY